MHGIATRTNDYQDYTALYIRYAGHEPPIPSPLLSWQESGKVDKLKLEATAHANTSDIFNKYYNHSSPAMNLSTLKRHA